MKKTVMKKTGKKTLTLSSRLKKIRLLALDVDGVLTDGRIFWVKGSGWTRFFHVHDGYGIRILQNSGIPVALVSGGNSDDIRERAAYLHINHLSLGKEDKLSALMEISEQTGIPIGEMAFMGDEIYDLPALQQVGFSATVPDAIAEVKRHVHYVTRVPGGAGAVREIIDLLMKAK